ncbi:MAG: hypothetical protein M1833_004803 [Piccolia ochrophora]|nr:MAG: hypothetical protein M1833_004803 [Piccolia ochrophora]
MPSLAHFVAVLACSAALSVASPLEDIFGRSVGDSCKAPEGKGTCQNTSKCKGISYPTGLCPNDPNDVQCCVNIKCNADGGSGYCRSKSNNGCPNGKFHPGTKAPYPCPGDDDILCCIESGGGGSEPPPPPPPSGGGSDVGSKILAKALEAKGLPYAWGGGSCKGPSHGDEPTEIGFDCSGLVSWAVCQITGRDLFSEGLRVTRSMYCASESKLKYKKYPLSQRKAGDAIFFGGACDCGNSETIHHVGLMMDAGDRMWNAPNNRVNKVQENSIKGFSEEPCPSVIRFTN